MNKHIDIFYFSLVNSDDDLASSPELATPGLGSRTIICNDAESVSSDLEGSLNNFSRKKAIKGTKNVEKARKPNENIISRGHNYDSDADVDVVSLSTHSTLTSTTDRRMRYSSRFLLNHSSYFTLFG